MKRTALTLSLSLPWMSLGLVAVALAQPDPPPQPASPALERGDRGDTVRILQHLLVEARRQGITSLRIGIDGAFGPKTAAGVVAFQRAAKLPATGRVDAATWRALRRVAARGPLGKIDPLAPATGDVYSRSGPRRDVEIHRLPAISVSTNKRARPLIFESKFAVDADGAGSAHTTDPTGQSTTSLTYPGTHRSLDPTRIPYFVLPIGFEQRHRPHLELGDIAAVIHDGKVAYAIYGDRGPRTKIGEGSILLAKQLGIDADPRTGGLSGGGVFWVVFPGSGSRRPLTPAEIRRRGEALLKRAGGKPPTKAKKPKAGNVGHHGIIDVLAD